MEREPTRVYSWQFRPALRSSDVLQFLTVVLVLIGAPLHAAEPSFDCGNPASGAEEAICKSDALAALDVELERLYRSAVDGAHMTPDRLSELRTTQRGWIKGRDECWRADDHETCIRDAYAMRIHEIRGGYADARDKDGASSGPFPWVCDGMDAALSAVFVDGPEPLVSLNWGETWITLPQARSGSGARFEANTPDGSVTFWTKGNEATLVQPGNVQFACRLDGMS